MFHLSFHLYIISETPNFTQWQIYKDSEQEKDFNLHYLLLGCTIHTPMSHNTFLVMHHLHVV